MSSEIWKKEVIEHRGEYSQRAKLALHTSGREFLSWPTARLSDGEGGRIETVLNKTGFKSKRKASNQYFGAKLRDAVETYENWPTADATNVSDGIPWEISGKQLKERRARVKIAVAEGKTKAGSGRSVNLAMAVQREKTREEKEWIERKELSDDCKKKAWPTPAHRDYKGANSVKHIISKSESRKSHIDQLPTAVMMDGLQDQDKSNIDGKNQESWGTPRQSMANSPTEKQIAMGAPKKKIEDQVAKESWGTPVLGEAHLTVKSEKIQKNRKEEGKMNLTRQASAGGKLNPNWVEQLMGLPVGWTQLPIEWID
jgi:hypothetical protein